MDTQGKVLAPIMPDLQMPESTSYLTTVGVKHNEGTAIQGTGKLCDDWL